MQEFDVGSTVAYLFERGWERMPLPPANLDASNGSLRDSIPAIPQPKRYHSIVDERTVGF